MRRHCLVPGGVHDRAVSDLRKNGSRRFDSLDVRRIVQWSQRLDAPKRFDYLVIDDHRFGKFLTTMYYTVAHRFYLGNIGDRSDIFVDESIEYQSDRLGMIRAGVIHGMLISPGNFVENSGSFLCYSLDLAAG
jgi:hypothetical protein